MHYRDARIQRLEQRTRAADALLDMLTTDDMGNVESAALVRAGRPQGEPAERHTFDPPLTPDAYDMWRRARGLQGKPYLAEVWEAV